jgi:hypothetical protein
MTSATTMGIRRLARLLRLAGRRLRLFRLPEELRLRLEPEDRLPEELRLRLEPEEERLLRPEDPEELRLRWRLPERSSQLGAVRSQSERSKSS